MVSLGSLLYLSRAQIEKLNISVEEVINVVEKAFCEKATGRVEMPPKPGIHLQDDAFIHAMPAYIPQMKSAGVKWITIKAHKNVKPIYRLCLCSKGKGGNPYGENLQEKRII